MDLAEAPILELDDTVSIRNPQARSELGARLKEYTVAGAVRWHPKFEKPISFKVCQRILWLCNDDPQSLFVLPDLDASMLDKMMILKAAKAKMPMPTGTTAERGRFMETLHQELPAFLHHLEHEFILPEEMRGERFGVREYHHHEIVTAIQQLSPSARALEMIDELFVTGAFAHDSAAKLDSEYAFTVSKSEPWEGLAREFEKIMRAKFDRVEVDRLFRYGNSAGMLLGELSSRYPSRVKKAGFVHGGTHKWLILPPGGSSSSKDDLPE
ncbi:MAG: hypothetical protein QM796_10875 [Chthoniobacteraceae bacterium]